MQKIIVAGFGLFLSCSLYAAPPVMEAPISGYGTPVTIAISSTTLTMVPSSQTSGRVGIFIDVPYTVTHPVAGFFGNCTSTSLANTIRPIEISSESARSYISMNQDVCLWLLSLNVAAATQNIHYQEIKQ